MFMSRRDKFSSSIFGGWESAGDGPQVTPQGTTAPAKPRDQARTKRVQGTTLTDETDAAELMAAEQAIAADWQDGEVILGLYKVVGLLGSGGMGKVYRVHHQGWKEDLAVKSPNRETLKISGGKDSFVNEAETWVGLGLHPHIVSCYYVRTLGGIPRVFVEYVEGGTLAEWIRDGRLYQGPLREVREKILDMAIQFAWGLSYAHERGLVHQDVKPANVMVGADGVVKVTDFGLARAQVVDGESQRATLGGTPEYFSPEQARIIKLAKASVSPDEWPQLTYRTDIWSWGISVMEMFAGIEPPTCRYGGEMAAEVLQDYLQMELEADHLNYIPEAVAALLCKCLEKDPEQRPSSMKEIAETLQHIYFELTGRVYPRRLPVAGQGTAGSLNNRALSYLDLGKDSVAMRAWQSALAADPQHPETTYNRGVFLWRRGQLTDDALLQQMKSVQTLNREEWIDEYLLGLIQLERGDSDAAINLLKDAAQQAPEETEVRTALSQAQSAENQTEHAQQQTVFNGHTSYVNAACLNREGRKALSAGADQTVRLWDVETGQCVRSLEGHSGPVKSVCFSHDGTMALSGGADKTARLWNLETGRCLRTFKTSRSWKWLWALMKTAGIAIYSLLGIALLALIQIVFVYIQLSSVRRGAAPDTSYNPLVEVASRLIFGVFFNCVFVGLIVVFIVQFLGMFRRLDKSVHHLQGHKGAVNSVCLSDDGALAISGSDDKTVRLWDLKTGRRLHTFRGHRRAVTSVCLSRDGQLMISGSWDRTVKLWDMKTRELVRTFEGHGSGVNSVSLTGDNLYAISGSTDNSLRVWDMETGKCLHTFKGHTQAVTSVSVSQDGRVVLSGGWDHAMRMWDLKTGRCLRSFKAVSQPVTSVFTSTDGRLAISANTDSKLRLWKLPQQLVDVCTPQVSRITSPTNLIEVESALREDLRHGQTELERTNYSAALEHLKRARQYTGFERTSESLELWHQLSLYCRRVKVNAIWPLRILEGHQGTVRAVCFSDDGRIAVSGSTDNTLRAWETSTGFQLQDVDMAMELTALCLNHDGSLALTGSQNVYLNDYTVRLWDIKTGKWLRTFDARHKAAVLALCMTANQKYAITASADKTLCVWQVETGRCLRSLTGHQAGVTSVCLTEDEAYVLSGSEDGTARLWDIVTGRCRRTFTGHGGPITSLSLSADGRSALTASADRSMKLWDVSTGKCLHTFAQQADAVTSVCFSADGQFAVSASRDRTLRLWDIRSKQLAKTLEGHEDAVEAVSLSRDGRFILSGGADKNVRLWAIDWELEARPAAEWDEGARPYLDNFLALHCPHLTDSLPAGQCVDWKVRRLLKRGPQPQFVEADEEQLLFALRCAGYGWLRPSGVHAELEKMAEAWPAKTSQRNLRGTLLNMLADARSFLVVARKHTSKLWPLYLLLLVAGLLVLLITLFRDFQSSAKLKREAEAQRTMQEAAAVAPSIAGASWQVYHPIATGMSIRLPCEPRPTTLPFLSGPETEDIHVYNCEHAGFVTIISSVTIAKGYLSKSARVLSDETEQSLKSSSGFFTASAKRTPFKQGMLFSANFEMNGQYLTQKNFVMTRGRNIWKLILIYPTDDAAAASASQDVLDSLEIQ
jgi:WD40 repeat protein/serine/threonine protein kinase